MPSKLQNLMIFFGNLVIFGPKIVLEAILEVKLAPRGAQTGLRGDWEAPKSPQGGEEERQEGAKMAQEGPKEAHLEAPGTNFGRQLRETLVKLGVKIRQYRKRRIQQKPTKTYCFF